MTGLGLRLTSSTRSNLIRFKSRWGSRNLHKAPALPYSVEGGLGEFLPPSALKVVAEEYQGGLLERLNDEVRGTEYENSNLVDTVIGTSADEASVLAFNYASLALNNGYFLDQLKPTSESSQNHQDEISSHFAHSIREQHGSLAQLKSAFSAAATGLFTNGYIWFVTDANGNTGVLPTLGPGTLLIRSRTYTGHESWMQTLQQATFHAPALEGVVDLSADPIPEATPASSPFARSSPPGTAPQSPTSGVSGIRNPEVPNGLGPKFMHTSAVRKNVKEEEVENIFDEDFEGILTDEQEALIERDSIYDEPSDKPQEPVTKVQAINSGDVLYPLFCLPVHEHAWMAAGYGVWGKEEWLKKFWTVLDWQKVSRRYESIYRDPYKITSS